MWLCTRISVGRSCSALKVCNARATASEVVGVGDGGDVPAVGQEAGRHVLGEGDVGVALDRHPVRVVDPAEVGQPLVGRRARPPPRRCPPSCSRRRPGRRRRSRRAAKPSRLYRAASHWPAIAMPTEVATPWPSGPVVVSTPLVHRYSGWPGHLRVELAERPEVVEGDGRLAEHLVVGVDGLDAGEVEQRPQAGWRRGPRRARSGPGWARSGRPGRSAGTAARGCRRPGPCPSACRGGRSWPPGRRPCTGRGSTLTDSRSRSVSMVVTSSP